MDHLGPLAYHAAMTRRLGVTQALDQLATRRDREVLGVLLAEAHP